jgi:hypothetical protein
MIEKQSINEMTDGTNSTARVVYLFGGLMCKASQVMHESLRRILLAALSAVVWDDLFRIDRRRSASSDQRGQSLYI